MLIISRSSGGLPQLFRRWPAGRLEAGLLRRALSGCRRLLAALPSPRRSSAEAAIPAVGFDDAGDATLRDLGLERRESAPPYALADIHPGIESTRMRLFVMTGEYWRGS